MKGKNFTKAIQTAILAISLNVCMSQTELKVECENMKICSSSQSQFSCAPHQASVGAMLTQILVFKNISISHTLRP